MLLFLLPWRSMSKYEIILYWSEEDETYIAEVPELHWCMAHGKDCDDALSNIKEAIQLWIETAKKYGDSIPKPKGRLMYAWEYCWFRITPGFTGLFLFFLMMK